MKSALEGIMAAVALAFLAALVGVWPQTGHEAAVGRNWTLPLTEEKASPNSSKVLPAVALMADKAVVRIEGETPTRHIVGTGFFINHEGLVLTNRHIVEEPLANFWVVGADGRRYEIERIVVSQKDDLALLKTTATASPWLALADSAGSLPGKPVVMVNNGPVQPAAFGLLSGRKGSLLTDGNTVERDVIQIEARVRPGDSGSPLLDGSGKVMGVVFAYDASQSDVGFAVPVEKAAELVQAYYQ